MAVEMCSIVSNSNERTSVKNLKTQLQTLETMTTIVNENPKKKRTTIYSIYTRTNDIQCIRKYNREAQSNATFDWQ